VGDWQSVVATAEAVVLDQNQSDDQMSYEQVLSTIYANDNEAK